VGTLEHPFSGCLNHYLSPTVFGLQKAVGRAWAVSGKIRAAQPLSKPHFSEQFCPSLQNPPNCLKTQNRHYGI